MFSNSFSFLMLLLVFLHSHTYPICSAPQLQILFPLNSFNGVNMCSCLLRYVGTLFCVRDVCSNWTCSIYLSTWDHVTMGVCLLLYRARIGIHHPKHCSSKVKGKRFDLIDVVFINLFRKYKLKAIVIYFVITITKPDNKHLSSKQSFKDIIDSILSVVWVWEIILKAGDIELNPGPSSNTTISFNDSSSQSETTIGFSGLRNNLSFVQYNVQSLLPKLDVIKTELSQFDIIGLTETWLNRSVTDEDVNIDGYNLFRKDRSFNSYGGLNLYVKSHIFCKRRSDLEIVDTECIWLELVLQNKHMLFGLFYRPPNSPASTLDKIEQSIDLAIDTNTNDIVITGDFNIDFSSNRNNRFCNFLQTYDLSQLIEEYTHFTEHSESLIDLIIANNPGLFHTSGVGDPFLGGQIRYHSPAFGILKHQKSKAPSYKRTIWKYDQGNYDLLRQKFNSVNWDSLETDDLDTFTETITNTILSNAKSTIPNKDIMIHPKQPLWLNTNVRKSIRRRKRAHKKAKQTNRPEHWARYRQLRNDSIRIVRDSKTDYYKKLGNDLKNNKLNSKDWWKIVKSILGKNSIAETIPTLYHDGKYFDDPEDKANIINNYFQVQSSVDDRNASLPDELLNNNVDVLSDIRIDPNEVEETLKNLTTGKASGPDFINTKILKECASELCQPLCKLFNFSLTNKKFPKLWKKAHVVPIFKKDDKSNPKNYRPISLLSVVGKVLERIIFKKLYDHLLTNNILSNVQSGFRPGDSTCNQLIDIYNTFCKAIDEGKEIRSVFCDISKAFDRVWHQGLLFKLKSYGITGNLLEWFKNYLDNRQQCVLIEGHKSNWVQIKAGVPQGSILGPLLFLVYINDITTDIRSNIKLFADDTSLNVIVEDPIVAAQTLNSDLNTINEWAKTWLVDFNPKKTESLLISRKHNRHQHPTLYMNNETITEVNSHKHLGVILSSDGNWHEHINEITSKAWKRINILRKFKFFLDRASLEKMYFTFIRPLLEYCDIIWDNCTNYETDMLEKIHLEAARIVTGTTKLISKVNLLRETGWETLDQRRKKHKLIKFFNMYHGNAPQYLSDLVPPLVSYNSSYSLRNSQNLQGLNCRIDIYKNSFIPSVVKEWNTIPLTHRQNSSISSFKRYLNRDTRKPPSYYYSGKRKSEILHTRIRTESSSLKAHLHSRNLIPHPFCQCGQIEDSNHYFLSCPLFQTDRHAMLDAISKHCLPSLNVILFGVPELPTEANKDIFEAVQSYIISSKRFD